MSCTAPTSVTLLELVKKMQISCLRPSCDQYLVNYREISGPREVTVLRSHSGNRQGDTEARPNHSRQVETKTFDQRVG